jgi:hypothetical protein
MLTLFIPAVATVSAQAQVTPKAEFQNSTITSTNNTISATRVPVLDSTGAIHYRDITLLFNVEDSTTNGADVTLASGYPMVVKSASPIQVDGFEAGTYRAPGGGAAIAVTGPGVTSGGATEWSLAQSSTACTFPYSATWYVGPISSNPLYARLKKAGITSTAYSYGLLGTASGCGDADWDSGALLGFSQTGKSLTIVSFSHVGTEDSSVPREQITFTQR